MAGMAENLNVRITLKLKKKTGTKVACRWKRFSIERLSSDYCATIKQLFHSAEGTLF